MQNGANVNVVDAFGETALARAADDGKNKFILHTLMHTFIQIAD